MGQELAERVQRIDTSVEAGIATVVINQPSRRNAMNLAMWDQLAAAVSRLDADPSVRVLVLRGAGDVAFCAGADITEFRERRSTPEQALAYNRRVGQCAESLIQAEKPLIALVHGFCVGGGLEIALGCDLRIAADNAVFGIPAARLGISYGHADIKRLVDVVGPSNAKLIFFTADPRIPAQRAYDMGLVNELVPADRLEARVYALAAEIAEGAPSSVRWAKSAIEHVLKDPGLVDIQHPDELAAELFGSDDFKEGLAAFLEKRQPHFSGR